MILRARTVVTMDGPPIENGAVAIESGKVVDVGTFADVARGADSNILDLGEQVLMPGLINAHCHLDYTLLRGTIPRQKSFTDWIRAINAEKAKLMADDYVRSIEQGFEEAKRFGTTSIANLTAFPELISRITPPVRTWWFAELIDVREPQRAPEIVDKAVEGLRTVQTESGGVGLAPHALYTASADLYRRCETVAETENLLLTTHLGESREESEMFRDGSGALYDFLKEIGRDMSDCGAETAFAEFLNRIGRGGSPNRPKAIEVNRPYLPWIVTHLNDVTDADVARLQASEKFHVMHCPRSHAFFNHSPFQFARLLDLGFNISLGTDSLASNTDLSLFEEMRQFQKTEPQVSATALLSMVTVNPARALRKETLLGRIHPGYEADLIALPIASPRRDVFEAIVGFDHEVSFSMVGGEVIHRKR